MSRPTTMADVAPGPEFLAYCRVRKGRPVSGLVLLSMTISAGHAHEHAASILSAMMRFGDIRSKGPDPKCPAMQRGYLVGELYEAT